MFKEWTKAHINQLTLVLLQWPMICLVISYFITRSEIFLFVFYALNLKRMIFVSKIVVQTLRALPVSRMLLLCILSCSSNKDYQSVCWLVISLLLTVAICLQKKSFQQEPSNIWRILMQRIIKALPNISIYSVLYCYNGLIFQICNWI